MERRSIWFLMFIVALFLVLTVPCVEAEDQRVPIQTDPAPTPTPSDTRRPLVAPNSNAETQRVPVQTSPAPTPTPSGTRRPLVAPNSNTETQRVPDQTSPAPTPTPSGTRRPLVAPNSNAETQRVQTGGTPQATETPDGQSSFTERHGYMLLTVLLTTEQIIRCKNEGLSSDDCAYRLLEQAAVGTGITLGAMLTGTAPVLVAVGTATMTVKGFQNSVEIMYEGGSLVQALIEKERVERERERQQEKNRARLAEMLDLEQTKTLGLVQGQAQTLEGLCRNLEDMATEAEKYGNLAQEKTLVVGPEITAEIAETAKLCVNATTSAAHIGSIRDRVAGYASQIREALERLNSQCRSCTTSEEAEKIREGYDACTGLMRGIRQLHDEALQKGNEIRRIQSNAARLRSIVDMASKSKEHIFTLEGHTVKHSRVFEETLQSVIDVNNSLVSACAESDRNIANLRKAFGELSPEDTARFTELKELVDSFRGKVCDYDPLKSRYDNARYQAVDARLTSENLIRSLEGSIAGLDECDSASVDTLLTDIAAAEQDATLAIAAHADLSTMANECATRSATGTGAGSGETDGGDADDDFSDEGTIIGSGGGQDELEPDRATDESSTAQEPIPELADAGSSGRPERPSAPEAGDDFADLGSNVGSAPPRQETVTYFDRDWLPRSWKTSGNAAETRTEIYQTASRLGWAAALAEYTGPSSDPLISDHITSAAGHMERANAASFAPHKAWPDWSNRRTNYNRWIQRLTSGSQISREYFRKGLANTLRSEAGALKRQLETLATGQAGTLQNCDTYIFEIGYQLAFASQLQSIAIDGLKAGQKKDWARKLWNRASSSIASAGSAIRQIKPGPGRAGCSDFTPLSKELAVVQSRLSSAPEPEVHGIWNQGLAIAGGRPGMEPDMEAVGRHVFMGMESEVPQGAHISFQGSDLLPVYLVGGNMAPSYKFQYKKSFRREYVIDNNPGAYVILHYVGATQFRKLDHPTCGLSDNLSQLENKTFVRHDGQGRYCLSTHRNVSKPIDVAIISRLIWFRGEWAITIWAYDYPNHPGTQFGGQKGQLNHIIRLLDRLVPRLETIPPGAMAPGNDYPSSRQSGSSTSPSSRGTNLLGIEAQ